MDVSIIVFKILSMNYIEFFMWVKISVYSQI